MSWLLCVVVRSLEAAVPAAPVPVPQHTAPPPPHPPRLRRDLGGGLRRVGGHAGPARLPPQREAASSGNAWCLTQSSAHPIRGFLVRGRGWTEEIARFSVGHDLATGRRRRRATSSRATDFARVSQMPTEDRPGIYVNLSPIFYQVNKNTKPNYQTVG